MRRLASKLWNLVQKKTDSSKRRRKPAAFRPWRPFLESLEDRMVPAIVGLTSPPPAVLSGLVFLDSNANNVHNAGEPVIPGIAVTLTGLTAGTNEQTVTVSGTTGTFTLTFNSETTTALSPTDANLAADMQNALNALPTVKGVSDAFVAVSRSAKGVFTVNFEGSLATNTPLLTSAATGTAKAVVTAGAHINISTTTNATGQFLFSQVQPGTYTLTRAASSSFIGGDAQAGSLGGTASGATISNITVSAGQDGLHYDFGMIGLTAASVSLRSLLSSSTSSSGIPFPEAGPGAQSVDGTVQPKAAATAGTASLAGSVINTSTKAGIAGVQLSLSGTDSTGRDILKTATTNSSGAYSFTALNAGTYTINVVSSPLGFSANLASNPGSPAGSLGGLIVRNDQITNISIAAAASGTGYNFGEMPLPSSTTSGTLSLTAALADDTAGATGTTSDGITSDDAITGRLQHSSALTSFTANFGTKAVNIRGQLQSNGAFYLDPALLNQIAASALSDGLHTLTLKATDAAGHVVTVPLTFTLHSTAPAVPTLSITTPVSTLGTTGIAVVSGSTSPNVEVVLTQGTNPTQTTTSAADGSFSFNVTLQGGANAFTVQAIDNAGNTSQFSTSLVNPIALTNPTAQTENLTTPTNPTNTTNDQNVDLAGLFTDPNASGTLITFFTSAGPINVKLLDATTPQTVANFINYIESGAYTNDIFHRLASNPIVLQGGGFTFQTNPNNVVPISVNPAIANEFSSSNPDSLGTLAMAKQGGNANSATSQFFFNTGDNSSSLGSSNDGGFTVFGSVVSGADMRILNTLDAFPVVSKSPPTEVISFTTSGPEPTMTATSSLTGTKPTINVATTSPGATPSTDAIQTITFGGTITGGTFTLTFNGQTTAPITWSSNSTTLSGNIQSALNAILSGTHVSLTVAESPAPFSQLPLKGFSGAFPANASAANFALINGISIVQQSDSLTYSIVSNTNPNIATVSINANDWFQIHPVAVGSTTVTVQAKDQFGSTAQVTFTVNVTNPVSITTPATQTNLDEDVVSLPISASDSATGTTLSYSATGLPPGLSINSSTGVISGTIAGNADVNSPYNVTVTAVGGTSSKSATFSWIVNPVVKFTSANPGSQTTMEGQSASLPAPTVTDVDSSNAVTFSVTGLPPGLSIDNTTGAITGTVGNNAHTGSPYTVTITATDSVNNAFATQTFSWIITPVVTFTQTANQSSTVGESVSLTVAAADANSTALTLKATGLPKGLSMNASGKITGVIAAGDNLHSPVTVTVTASDGTFSNTETFTWTVTV